MDSNINKSDFRFEEYKILRSFISIKRDELPDDEYNINISPSGIKSKDRFDLTLKIEIKDKNEVVSIDITVVGIFYFRENIDIKMLPHYFAVNAPAILFPYIRAYISLLTSLSGVGTVLLPTLNLSSLSKELLNNIKEE